MVEKTILLVDEDKEFCGILSKILKDKGYSIFSAGEGMQALNLLKKIHPALVLLDSGIIRKNGMPIIEEMKEIDANLIIITTSRNLEEDRRTFKFDAYDYLIKPFINHKQLIHLITRALQNVNSNKEIDLPGKESIEQYTNIVGKSTLINEVFKQIKTVANTNLTVILQGESGTGKELIAREIHRMSMKKDKPFVPIDCGAIPESLFESELFGYDKGAFTGADKCKSGKFELANGGTILLDEITNLSTSAQGKFLRAVEERKILHLGGKTDINVNLRIIVATNANLFDEVKKGNFRHDLYFRFNEFMINIPTLRERKDDIPLLCQYFLKQLNNELCINVCGVSSEAEKLIMGYDWPGNIRELRNVIRRAAILTESNLIMKEHLPSEIVYNSHLPNLHTIESQSINHYVYEILENGSTLCKMKDIIVKEFEQKAIMEALKKAKNNKTIAAKLLKIDRKTLYSKLLSIDFGKAS
jgi:DNA-binding NtrC family response regulator